MYKVHPASLVQTSYHSRALLDLLTIEPTSRPLIDYLINVITDVVSFALGRQDGSSSDLHPEKFTSFVTSVLLKADISTPVLLSALTYIRSAKPYLHVAHEELARYRVFLGALICASKFLNDTRRKNCEWSTITGTFGVRDIGRIEREWCAVLDFDFIVSEADILAHYAQLKNLVPISKPTIKVTGSLHEENLARTLMTFDFLPTSFADSPPSPISSTSSSPPDTPSDSIFSRDPSTSAILTHRPRSLSLPQISSVPDCIPIVDSEDIAHFTSLSISLLPLSQILPPHLSTKHPVAESPLLHSAHHSQTLARYRALLSNKSTNRAGSQPSLLIVRPSANPLQSQSLSSGRPKAQLQLPRSQVRLPSS
ncbi:hypothetical protein JAAARDRAFT_128497 [Jaapia argillacea MUCL 33604]|uniref:Cyclin N-terminal domain-containing protein n=1 Tax=Jaapia argillacea MUCL 33604 TaxID=933084 RepID=A0A067PV78_9AGAM|nr:hypothetical protein JAAARDRAFT_128497 [Jaapia argillacea MUCL 33604]